MISLTVNGKRYDVDVTADMPLLWVIRETIGLTGTKFGCGLSQCGACTVHLDGNADPVVLDAGVDRRRQEGHDDRRAVADLEPRAAGGVGRRAGAAVRLLPVGTDDVGGRAAGQDAEADRRARSTPP